jgi:hydroxylamine dehydrogenase
MVPELEELVAAGMASGDPEKVKAAKALQAKLDEVLASDNHKWYLGQREMPAKAKK